jgi:hypothetical protein
MRAVHDHYFEPKDGELRQRTISVLGVIVACRVVSADRPFLSTSIARRIEASPELTSQKRF